MQQRSKHAKNVRGAEEVQGKVSGTRSHPGDLLEVLHHRRAQLRQSLHGEAPLGVDVQSSPPDAAELVRNLHVHGQLHAELGLAHPRRPADLAA